MFCSPDIQYCTYSTLSLQNYVSIKLNCKYKYVFKGHNCSWITFNILGI